MKPRQLLLRHLKGGGGTSRHSKGRVHQLDTNYICIVDANFNSRYSVETYLHVLQCQLRYTRSRTRLRASLQGPGHCAPYITLRNGPTLSIRLQCHPLPSLRLLEHTVYCRRQGCEDCATISWNSDGGLLTGVKSSGRGNPLNKGEDR